MALPIAWTDQSGDTFTCHLPPACHEEVALAAALLHDVDDDKYFPRDESEAFAVAVDDGNDDGEDASVLERRRRRQREQLYLLSLYPNAVEVMKEAQIDESSYERVLFMIEEIFLGFVILLTEFI